MNARTGVMQRRQQVGMRPIAERLRLPAMFGLFVAHIVGKTLSLKRGVAVIGDNGEIGVRRFQIGNRLRLMQRLNLWRDFQFDQYFSLLHPEVNIIQPDLLAFIGDMKRTFHLTAQAALLKFVAQRVAIHRFRQQRP